MSLYRRWLEQIAQNEAQFDAFGRERHTVVIAGPGSGKTHLLALKISQLLRERIPPPQGVACLTYTRMMAGELKRRLSMLGVGERPNIFVGTVHSFCLGQVVQPFSEVFELGLPKPIRIASLELQHNCLGLACEEAYGTPYDPERNSRFDSDFATLRRQRADLPFECWTSHGDMARAIMAYERRLIDYGYVDFDIIVQRAMKLISEQALVRQSLNAKYAWFAVDEYQDLGYPLFRVVTEMLDHSEIKLFAIGDPAQAIFDFAGTDPKYLLQLADRADMKPTVELQQNYRSTKELVTIAQVILKKPREQRCGNEGGHCRIYECPGDDEQQAPTAAALVRKYREAGYGLNQIAVLHPWRHGLEQIGECLSAASIDYFMDNHPLYDRSLNLIHWLEGLAYWCLMGFGISSSEDSKHVEFDELLTTWRQLGRVGPFEDSDNAATRDRICLAEVLWRFRGKDHFLGDWLPRISEALDIERLLPRYDALYPDEVAEYGRLCQLARPGQPLSRTPLSQFANTVESVQLTTIHSSKGTEFDVVIIAGVEKIETNANGRRLLYVGATRAKRELCLLYTKIHPTWSRSKFPVLPHYIKEIKAAGRAEKWAFYKHYTV